MSLIEIAFDYKYYTDLEGLGSKLSWEDALEYYSKYGVPKCIQPNALDPLFTEYYFKSTTGEGACTPNQLWLGEHNANETKITLDKYFANNIPQKNVLFQNNVNELGKSSPEKLEKIGLSVVRILQDLPINPLFGFVVNKLSKFDGYIPSESFVEVVRKEMENRYKDPGFIKKGYDESSIKLLTNFVLEKNDDFSTTSFVDFLHKKDVSSNIRAKAFEVFSSKVSNPNWHLQEKVIEKFITLLPFDEEGKLAKGILQASDVHGYVTTKEEYLYLFKAYLQNSELRGMAANFIKKSLAVVLSKDDANLKTVEELATEIFNKTSSLGKALTIALIDSYSKQQLHFGELIENIIAEDKTLDIAVLKKLSNSINFKDVKTRSLFIALRLSQYGLKLDEEIIQEIKGFLSNKDYADRIFALKIISLQGFDNQALEIVTSNIKNAGFYEANLIKEILKEAPRNSSQNSRIDFCLPQVFSSADLRSPLLNEPRYGYLKKSLENLVKNFGWDEDLLLNYIKINKHIESFGPILEKISDYNLYSEMVDKRGQTLASYFENSTLTNVELDNKISKLIQDDKFFLEKKAQVFLSELKKLNANSPKVLELIDSGYFEKQLLSMKQKSIELNIKNWSSNDFNEWRKNLLGKIDYNDLGEILAVISAAVFKTIAQEKWEPRYSQILSLLSLLKHGNGALAEISTGEGKSIILGMFAAVKIFENRKVDIITSSRLLAQRDSEELKGFYDILAITSGSNVDIDRSKVIQAYSKQVVYGDIGSFISDDLRDITGNIRNGRPFDILIVDEVDNMFIDQMNKKVQLSSSQPGSSVLNYPISILWGIAVNYLQNMQQASDGCIVTQGGEQSNSTNVMLIKGKSCQDVMISHVSDFLDDQILNMNSKNNSESVHIPTFLKEFAAEHKGSWLESLVASFTRFKDIDYTIIDGAIVPINLLTGDTEKGLKWSNGIHQMLSLKERLSLIDENIVNTFRSYVSYFPKYEGGIYGVTGTLGKDFHQEFLANQYGVDTFKVPPYVKKDITEHPAIITHSEAEWENQLVTTLDRKILDKRAALIIVPNLVMLKGLKDIIIKNNYSKEKIYTYGYGTKAEEEIIKRELKPGEVIIATNLAGRGVDIKISPEVIHNGGLHVIQTYVSDSSRIDDQAAGRAARAGAPGSSQYIGVSSEDCDISCLKAESEFAEKTRLKEYEICYIPSTKLIDTFFESYVELDKFINSPTKYRLELGKIHLSTEYQTAFISTKTGSDLLIEIEDNNKETIRIDITNAIKTIDPSAYEHIKNIVNTPNSKVSGLSNQDYEIIHFMISINSLSLENAFINRVNDQFNNLANNYASWYSNIIGSGKQQYLRQLLLDEKTNQDLLKEANNGESIDDRLLGKVELREKYRLWLEDRAIYNNKYESSQIKDNFGIWLQQQDQHFSKLIECTIDEPNKFSKILSEVNNTVRLEFDRFSKETYEAAVNKILIKNPAYHTFKAWTYIQIKARSLTSIEEVIPKDSYLNTAFTFFKNMANTVLSKISPPDLGNFVITDPVGSALEFLHTAIDQEPIFSWPASDALGTITLINRSPSILTEKQINEAMAVKREVYGYASDAYENLNEHIIPQEEAHLATMLALGTTEITDPLAVKQLAKIEANKRVSQHLQNNMEFIINLPRNYMIRAKEALELETLMDGINITQSIFNQFNSTRSVEEISYGKLHSIEKSYNDEYKAEIIKELYANGVIPFKYEPYELHKEKKDWLGNIFAAVVSIACIATGVGIAAVGLGGAMFSSSLSLSLIGMGAGGLFETAASIVQGEPIDFKSFIRSKGIALGVSIATAGLLSFAEGVAQSANIVFLQKATDAIKSSAETIRLNPALAISQALVTETVVSSLGSLVGNALKKGIDAEDIYTSAENLISSIIATFKEQLALIYATDDINKNDSLTKMLFDSIDRAITKHERMFHDDASQFSVGVAGNAVGATLGGFGILGLSNVVNTGMKAGMGMYKNSEALRKVGASTRDSIGRIAHDFAYNADSIFKNKLEVYGGDSVYLYDKMGKSYKHCVDVEKIGQNNDFRGHDVKAICDEVAKLLDGRDFSSLKNYFKERVGSLVKNIQKNEIVKPVASGIASDIYSRHLHEKIDKHLKSVFAQSQKQEEGTIFNKKKPSIEEQAKKLGISKEKLKEMIDDDRDEDAALRDILEDKVITLNENVEIKKLFSGIIDGEITSKDLPPLNAKEEALNKYIKDNPKVVSAKLLDLLITSAHANEGKPITEEQKQSIIRKFINDIGGGIISGEKYVGEGLRENLPNIMYAVDKSLEAVGVVLLASATGWTLALSDAKSYKEAGDKVEDFIAGVEETLNEYTTKEERKVLEYSPVGLVAGKVIKQGLNHILEGGILKQFEGVFFTKTGIKLVKDARLDGYTSEAAYKLLEKVHFSEIKTAEIMNEQLSKYYSKPPFIAGGKVGTFQTDGAMKFVRVFTEGQTSPSGRFLMLSDDIKGLTPLQIKNKFDLPHVPTHVVDVNLPKGKSIAVGAVNEKNFGGTGKGTQFYSLDEVFKPWLSNKQKL